MAWVFIPSAGDPVQRDTCGTWAVNPYKRLFSCVPPQCSVPMESTYYLGDAGIRQLASLFSEGGKRNTCTSVCTYTHTYTHAHQNKKKEKTRTHSLCLHSLQAIWRLFPGPLPAASLSSAGKAQNTNGQILDFCFLEVQSTNFLLVFESILFHPFQPRPQHCLPYLPKETSYFFSMLPSPRPDAFRISLTFSACY